MMRDPAGVRSMSAIELPALASALRMEMLEAVSKTGGHLASSLGAVELAIGLLRVFDPSRDSIVWDVGHQTYAWKMLTGRYDRLSTLRALGGLSGFCNPSESSCDAFISGHAGNALAAAGGLAVARDITGGYGHVVAVVGEASLLNGESLEALVSDSCRSSRLILVVNDNSTDSRLGAAFFTAFGMRYLGPVDGHDVAAVEAAFRDAQAAGTCVAVHLRTVKGKGFAPAERNPSAWHVVGPFDLQDAIRGKLAVGSGPESAHGWSGCFGAALCELARKDGRICALTAAMPGGTGLGAFAHEFPLRFFDAGICEGMLVTFAAGLAKAGLRPVVAVYSAFLQRAVDQIMHDVCLQRLPVVFAVDHAGCVGPDGFTHHGMFDIPMLRCLPDITILQPRDAVELAAMLSAAVEHDGPVAIRYPKGMPADFNDARSVDGLDGLDEPKAEVILSGGDASLQIWALGDQVQKAIEVAGILGEKGVEAGVVNARFVKPVDADLLTRQIARGVRIVALENGSLAGGFGSAIQEAAPGVGIVRFGWPDGFIPHGTIVELESAYGLAASQIASRLLNLLTR